MSTASTHGARATAALCLGAILCTLQLTGACAKSDDSQSHKLPSHKLPSRKIPSRDIQFEKLEIASLDVAVWQPPEANGSDGKKPLIIFSHGFGGSNTQSIFLMKALAEDGYIVVAPNHHDAHGLWRGLKPQVSFTKPGQWSATTFDDRRKDLTDLLSALKSDSGWQSKIDFDRVGLCGHSLGGYTTMALAGAWPEWKISGVKALLALSPFTAPFVVSKTLDKITVPIMYQGGSKDNYLTPSIIKEGGVYDQTPAPAYLVDFEGANHFAWTGFNHDGKQKEQIDFYSLQFFDHYLKEPERQTQQTTFEKHDGVVELRSK